MFMIMGAAVFEIAGGGGGGGGTKRLGNRGVNKSDNGRDNILLNLIYTNTFSYSFHRNRKLFFVFSTCIYTKTTENDNF